MALTLGSLLLSLLLFVNAIAVLNEERFLARVGWQRDQPPETRATVKGRLVGLLYAVHTLLPIPLVIANGLSIAILLILG